MADDGRIERREVIIPYCPRSQFLPYHNTTKRWRILVCHRRAGKTVAQVNEMIRTALTCPLPNPRTAYIAPLFKQAKDVAWSYAKQYGLAVPGAEANESELRIDFPNGGRFRLYGADNPDAIRGIYLDDCALDEFADMRPRFLPEVIRPALSDRQGRLGITGTPKGHNEFYRIWAGDENWEGAQKDDEWFSLLLRASESGLVAEEELASARKMMSEAQYAQEYECSFEAAIEGAYYGILLETAEREGRIADFPHNPALPVHTSWDLGIRHDSAIWFAQKQGGYLNFIDYYAAKNQDAAHYVKVLRDKPYVYAKHYFPHDIDRVDGWVNKTNRLASLKELGLTNIKVIDKTPRDDGINAVMLLLPTWRFDRKKCDRGIEALKQYRREWDDDRKCFKKDPFDDWTADTADAIRMMAQGIEPDAAVPPDIPKYSRRKKGIEQGNDTWMTA